MIQRFIVPYLLIDSILLQNDLNSSYYDVVFHLVDGFNMVDDGAS